jgi:predicted enzyme related to lactoylglutathione lyase
MSEVNEHAPGTPCWVDLTTPDQGAAQQFYGGLLSWAFEDMGPDAGGYVMCMLNGKQVAGMGPMMGEGVPSMWSSYVATGDADATAKAVESAGGSILAPAFDVMEAGRMAVFTDSTGAAISVWQARQTIGAQLVNEPGAFCWNELATRDVEGAKQFYQAVFGWDAETSDMDGMSYTEWKLEGKSIGGMMPMGDRFGAEVPPHWLVYFAVDDTDSSVSKVTELGGQIVAAAMDSPAGRFAVVSDHAGAMFGIIKL